MSKAFKNYRGKRIVNVDKIRNKEVNNGLSSSKKLHNIDYCVESDMQIDIVKNCTKKTYIKRDYMQIDIVKNCTKKTYMKKDYMQIDIVKNCTKKTYMKKDYMQIDIVKKTVKISNKTDFMQIEEDHQPNIEDIRLIENYLKSHNLNKDIISAYVNDYKYKYSSVLNMGGIYNIHLWGDNMLK
jgi:hypothetical protein